VGLTLARPSRGGETVPNGDGLLLLGRTLYVVQNRLNQVAEFAVDRGGAGVAAPALAGSVVVLRRSGVVG
jgi:hypothetical protein